MENTFENKKEHFIDFFKDFFLVDYFKSCFPILLCNQLKKPGGCNCVIILFFFCFLNI